MSTIGELAEALEKRRSFIESIGSIELVRREREQSLRPTLDFFVNIEATMRPLADSLARQELALTAGLRPYLEKAEELRRSMIEAQFEATHRIEAFARLMASSGFFDMPAPRVVPSRIERLEERVAALEDALTPPGPPKDETAEDDPDLHTGQYL